MIPSELSAILLRAKEIYTERGENTSISRYTPTIGKVCALTAIQEAKNDLEGSEESAFTLQIAEKMCDLVRLSESLPRYNAEHTREEVIDLFQQAIDAL